MLIQIIHIRSINVPPIEWPEGYIYVGRRGRGFSGEFGNPFHLGGDDNRDEVCDKFDAWLDLHPEKVEALRALNPTHLVCFCAPLRCHAESYVRRLAS